MQVLYVFEAELAVTVQLRGALCQQGRQPGGAIHRPGGDDGGALVVFVNRVHVRLAPSSTVDSLLRGVSRRNSAAIAAAPSSAPATCSGMEFDSHTAPRSG